MRTAPNASAHESRVSDIERTYLLGTRDHNDRFEPHGVEQQSSHTRCHPHHVGVSSALDPTLPLSSIPVTMRRHGRRVDCGGHATVLLDDQDRSFRTVDDRRFGGFDIRSSNLTVDENPSEAVVINIEKARGQGQTPSMPLAASNVELDPHPIPPLPRDQSKGCMTPEAGRGVNSAGKDKSPMSSGFPSYCTTRSWTIE
jgi:hypothetical protein